MVNNIQENQGFDSRYSFNGYDIYVKGINPQELTLAQEHQIVMLTLLCNDYERFKYFDNLNNKN